MHKAGPVGRKRRWAGASGASLALLSLLSSCGSSRPLAAGAPLLRVGVAISLTGDLANEGRLTEEGYQLCQDRVNQTGGVKVGGRRLTMAISYADDESSPTEAARLVQQFDDEGIKFILGPYGSAANEAVAPVVQRNGQVMVDSAGADNAIFDHGYTRIFGVESPASNYAASMVDAIVFEAHPPPRRVAFLSADDSFSLAVAHYGITEARDQGLDVLPLITFPAGSTDLSSVVTRVRAERPDLVVETGHLVEGLALMRAAAELGLRPEGIAETVAPTDPSFVPTLGPLADGVIGSTQWVVGQPGQDSLFGTSYDYARLFRAKYGFMPDYHPAEASAACLALVLAIEKAGSTDPAKVAQSLANLNTSSFFGRISFAPNGQDVTKTMAVVQIQHGKAVTVWPPGLAQGRLIWPAYSSGAP